MSDRPEAAVEASPETRPPLLALGPAAGPFDVTPLVMIITAGLTIGAILQQPRVDYCVNDASRWNTIYYLVEHGTYEYLPNHGAPWHHEGVDPDKVAPEQKAKKYLIGGKYYDNPTKVPPFWTIDMVKIGEGYYSSKPPLLPTCLAGVVRLIEGATGADFKTCPLLIARTTLILCQVVPLLVCIWLLRQCIFRATDSAFVRSFCVAAAALGTYLTPWSVTLNNHVIAACTAMFALYAAVRVWYDGRREWYWFALAGFFAALTATLELPAGLLAVTLLVALLVKDRRRTLLFGLSAGLVPTIAGVVTNYLATGSVMALYFQKNQDPGPYHYPGSYWNQPQAYDALSEPKLVYVIHMLIGHHGFFLLTPILLLSLMGMTIHLVRRKNRSQPALAGFVLVLTAVLVAGYAVWTSDYGGWAQGFRWLFWVIPLWLMFLPAGVALLAPARIGRVVCYALLGISMITVGFALRGPWGESWAELLFKQF